MTVIKQNSHITLSSTVQHWLHKVPSVTQHVNYANYVCHRWLDHQQ